jgi:hypothetical protein
VENELRPLAEAELRQRRADSQTIELAGDIFEWYAQGGPNKVETEVRRLLAQTARAVKKGLKEAKETVPAKRTQRTRRR